MLDHRVPRERRFARIKHNRVKANEYVPNPSSGLIFVMRDCVVRMRDESIKKMKIIRHLHRSSKNADGNTQAGRMRLPAFTSNDGQEQP